MNGDKLPAPPLDSGALARVENALHASEEKYRRVLDTMDDAYYEVDLHGKLVMGNRSFYRMLGYQPEELAGLTNRDLQTPEMSARLFQTFNGVFRTGVRATWDDWEVIHKNGNVLTVEGSVQLMRDAEGREAGFCGILRDVTARRRTEQALRSSEERYRSIIESIRDAYYEVDVAGNMVLCNDAFCRMLGYTRDEVIGRNNRDFQKPEHAAEVFRIFNRVYQSGVPTESFDWKMLRKDGSTVTGEGSVQLVRGLGDEITGFRGILRDVTTRRRVEHALRESEARFRALTKLSSDWYWEQDADFRYTRMEGRDERAAAVQALFLGRRPWETALQLESGDWQAYRALLAARQPFRDVVLHRRLSDGGAYYVSVSGEPVFDGSGNFTGYRGVSREITGQKLAEERIQHLATHDGLTGLPNRMMFSQLLARATAAAQRRGQVFAVLFIDLDRFKAINDTLGHDAGDALLRQVCARFKGALRAGDVIARLGGDEFVVLLQDLQDGAQAQAVADKLLEAASRPAVLLGRECRVTASIGIAMFPEHGGDEQQLMKHADIAMYHAKEEGKNAARFFSQEIVSQSLERLTMENGLRCALERGELRLHYQARCRLADGRVTGVEALLRWTSPELGEVPPTQFIPMAEETGLVIGIGKWVLHTACAQNVAWQRMGLPPVSMAVNLSVRQFGDDRLVDDIAAILRETGMAPELLELEITEGMVVQHPEQALAVLNAIRALGVRLAIDDFGAGYSSLGQLKHFPVDTLKVDQSFIRDIGRSAQDKAIAEAIVAIGRTLNLTVVAEGVETAEQESFLRARGCDEMQGFHFSMPLPADEFAALLRAAAAMDDA
ncbi:MAG TPA: EAL domain-containing protein [Noviherbaspirillum sp.]|jgi:diguanylate cyclase (GGDEF)-like protein/PAS domain S-box-containing protein|uniref:sensor domain-containing protein n=1 Tax=Noviherbaspirillum sp. TaxID=1926288 RepID=UPI002F95AAF3